MKKAVIALVCAAAVFIAVACRPHVEPAPLKPDPRVMEQNAADKARAAVYKEAKAMTPAQVEEVKATLTKDPDDLKTLEKLLMFYAHDFSRVQPANAAEIAVARRPYILRLIERHPESELAGSWGARIFPSPRDPLMDPAGYAQVKKLWLQQANRPDASITVLRNAARFFEAYDKPLSEQMLLRVQAKDAQRATRALGRLYALVLVGANASMPLNVVRTNDVKEAHSPYAMSVRKKLESSTDAVLLDEVCVTLIYNASSARLDFDREALAHGYCKRALQIDPSLDMAQRVMAGVAWRERGARRRALLKDVSWEQRYEKISTLPESERFEWLTNLAGDAFGQAVDLEYNKHEPSQAKEQWRQSKLFANDALKLAPKFTSRDDYGKAIYEANTVLGAHALREGDVKLAVAFLRAAAAAPRKEPIEEEVSALEDQLVHGLLKLGERQSIIDFYDREAQLKGRQQRYAIESAAALRAGVMPRRYQYTLDRDTLDREAKAAK